MLNADYLLLSAEVSLAERHSWKYIKWPFQMEIWLTLVIIYCLFKKESLLDNFTCDLVINLI